MEYKTAGEIILVLLSILILTFLMAIGNTNGFVSDVHAVPQSYLLLTATRMQC